MPYRRDEARKRLKRLKESSDKDTFPTRKGEIKFSYWGDVPKRVGPAKRKGPPLPTSEEGKHNLNRQVYEKTGGIKRRRGV